MAWLVVGRKHDAGLVALLQRCTAIRRSCCVFLNRAFYKLPNDEESPALGNLDGGFPDDEGHDSRTLEWLNKFIDRSPGKCLCWSSHVISAESAV